MSQLHCCELASFENAADGHTCEVVTHANQERLSGNSSAIFMTMHTCITLYNQSVPGTKPHKNNEPNISLPAKRCRQNAAGETLPVGTQNDNGTWLIFDPGNRFVFFTDQLNQRLLQLT